MKYHITLLFTLMAIIFGTSNSFAKEKGVYIRADIGRANYDSAETTIISGNGNIHNSKFHFKDSLSYNLGLGYKINKIFRTDVVFSSRKIDFDLSPVTTTVLITPKTASIDSESLMLSGYVNILPIFSQDESVINPYISAGIGRTKNKMDTVNTNFGTILGADSESFSWKLALGVDLKLTDNVSLDFSYSHNDLGEVKMGNGGTVFVNGLRTPGSADLVMREVSAGARYTF